MYLIILTVVELSFYLPLYSKELDIRYLINNDLYHVYMYMVQCTCNKIFFCHKKIVQQL